MEEYVVILAKDITDCDNCPLHGYDCCGGWSSSGSGEPIEPPCCSWNENQEIYKGMYDCDYEVSEQETERIERYAQKKEQEEKAKKEQQWLEEVRERMEKASNYPAPKRENIGTEWEQWLCPKCNRWFHPNSYHMYGGICESNCNHCGENLAYSTWLD